MMEIVYFVRIAEYCLEQIWSISCSYITDQSIQQQVSDTNTTISTVILTCFILILRFGLLGIMNTIINNKINFMC